MFEGLGGVSGYITERRLVRVSHDLSRPGADRERIGTIAERWGFGNDAAFSRTFRRRFGLSPREHRSAARAERSQETETRARPMGFGAIKQWVSRVQR
jgi:AraC-like DNA-binding protein